MKISILALAALTAVQAKPSDDSLKAEIVRKYLLTDQQKKMSPMFFEKQLNDVKDEYGKPPYQPVPDSIWDSVRVNVRDSDSFYEGFVGLLCEKFTLQELQDIDKAMNTPGMKKYMDYMKSEKSENDFGLMAMDLGRKISGRIEAYLTAKGFKK